MSPLTFFRTTQPRRDLSDSKPAARPPPSSHPLAQNAIIADYGDSDVEGDADVDTDASDSPPFFDAPSFFGPSPLRRRGSWTSGSTTFTSDEEDNGQLSLQDLGLGAAELLEQLEVERMVAAQRTPPRRPRQKSSEIVYGEQSGNVDSSPVAGPSTYQKTRRPAHIAPPLHTLNSSNSMSTIRNHNRVVSWTQTQLAELDIDSLLAAYDASSDGGSNCGSEDRDDLNDVFSTPTQPSRAANLTFPAPPSRTHSESHVSPQSPARAPLFSHVTSDNITRLRARPQGVADLPYADLFPISRSSPFPTKKKSSTSLRSQAGSETSTPPPPMPVFPTTYQLSSSPSSSYNSRTSPFQRCSIAVSSHSTDSSPTSQRSSYQSSVLSSDSFRWSTTSGSTAPTISEEEDTWSQGGRSPTKACYFPRRASDGSVYSDVEGSRTTYAPGGLMTESIDEDVPDVDWDKVLGAPQLHPSYRQSGHSFSSSGRSSPLDTGLNRVRSVHSLRRIRSNASLNPPPPIPSRSTSLHKKGKSKDKGKAKIEV